MKKPEELQLYHPYYSYSSYDSKGKYPGIAACIYVGKNLIDYGDNEDLWYFQDTKSFYQYGPFSSLTEEQKENIDYFCISLEQFEVFVFTLEEQIECLIDEVKRKLRKCDGPYNEKWCLACERRIPVNSKDYIVGEAYFRFYYYNPQMMIPDTDTCVYIGKNIRGDETTDTWYFQDPGSYCKEDNIEKFSDDEESVEYFKSLEPEYLLLNENTPDIVLYSLEEVIEELKKIAAKN